MSPILFNLDPLLCKLERNGYGFQRGSLKITAMAFADNLVLLSDSWDGVCGNIKILETFCELTRLQTQGKKCYGFYIKLAKDSYTINDCPAWIINGSPLSMIDQGKSEKYLGIRIDLWTGFAESGSGMRRLNLSRTSIYSRLTPSQDLYVWWTTLRSKLGHSNALT